LSSVADLSERLAAAVERLGGELGDALVATHEAPGRDTWVRIRTDAWRTAGEVLRHKLGFEYFDFLSAIDWLPSPFGRGEDDPTQPAPERDSSIRPGYTGGDTRFQVLARVFDVRTSVGLLLKVDVPDEDATVASWVPVYAGANWHERETWEMFGIRFAGHPDLRKLYLPTGFEGFPLRKDYPLLARLVKPWPGIVDVEPMPEGMGGEE
jgi:NADH-quinone oxidoreductase subunit C